MGGTSLSASANGSATVCFALSREAGQLGQEEDYPGNTLPN